MAETLRAAETLVELSERRTVNKSFDKAANDAPMTDGHDRCPERSSVRRTPKHCCAWTDDENEKLWKGYQRWLRGSTEWRIGTGCSTQSQYLHQRVLKRTRTVASVTKRLTQLRDDGFGIEYAEKMRRKRERRDDDDDDDDDDEQRWVKLSKTRSDQRKAKRRKAGLSAEALSK